MKTKFMIIIGIIMASSTVILVPQNSEALCSYDVDWPQKPCYDVWPMPSNEQMRKDWQGYYYSKGHTWMEEKKSEMMQAIKDGNIHQWIQDGLEKGDYANHNVWYYYYLNDQVLNYSGEVFPIPNKIDMWYLVGFFSLAGLTICLAGYNFWKQKILFKRSILVLIVAMTTTLYGFFHISSTLPFLMQFDLPYPFPHITGVERTGEGTQYQIHYYPDSALPVDPYWLVWSMIFYFGIILLAAFFSYVAIARIRKN
jgi:hypothetical protein